MRSILARRAAITAALLLAGVCAGVQPALAATPAGTASLGSANFHRAVGAAVTVPALAQCSVHGPTNASSSAVEKRGLAFGGGTSSCKTTVVNAFHHTTSTTSQATGRNFELSALVTVGGPRITIRSYQVSCTGSQHRTSATWSIGGMSGLGNLPSSMPVGYVKRITRPNGQLLATAQFNIQQMPGDGSIAVTILKITFAPASGYTGTVTVGTAACTPTP